MRAIAGALLVSAAAAALVACSEPTAAPDVVARLGERQIGYADFEEYLRMSSLDAEVGLGGAVMSGLFDQFILEELLLTVAREEGLEGADRRRIVDRLIERRASEAVESDDVERYYREHPEEFDLPERVTLRQILVDDRQAAARALERLRAGEPFEVVARSVEEGESEAGWEQAELTRDSVPPAFVDTIFSLEVGRPSEIVEAEYGFFIFEVTDRQPREKLSLERAAERIRRELRREAADEALATLVAEASRRYNVAVFAQNLPFEYQGNYRRNAATP